MRDQDFHRSRRRDFDADTYYPQPRVFGTRPRGSQPRFEAPSGPPLRSVELSDGSGDAFLHGSVLAQRGIGVVQSGETLEVHVGPGHKGPHVTEVLGVDSSTAPPVAPRRSTPRSSISYGPSSDTAVEETGRVKWFNTAKGYGFIIRDTSAEDVFVHVSALERSGLTGLSEGDRVIVDIADGRKGPEAARVRLV